MDKALNEFITKKIDAEEKLLRITEYVANHCNEMPEDVTWANVGDMNHLNNELDNIIKFFNL